MLFNSFLFLVFFAFVYIAFHYSPFKYRKFILYFSSILFYGSWDILNFDTYIPRFLIHFLTVISINYFFLRRMESVPEADGRKKYLTLAIIFNVINLGFFKYFYFLTEILGDLTGRPGLREQVRSEIHIILPIAISFYTFQIIAYLIDYHKGVIKEKTSYLDFSIFVLFFPQQLAGPILRAHEFMPQLKVDKELEKEDIVDGISLIGFGLIKKVVLADSIAAIIDPVYANPSIYSSQAIMIACAGFIFQLWGDFSGYSDIARGCGRLLGFQLPKNFTGPLFATGFKEMWARWHMTLSGFLRDYIYFPLGGSRGTEFRISINNLTTMFIAGIWHGANWTFIVWGLIVGLAIVLERAFLDRFYFWRESKALHAVIIKVAIINIFWFFIGTVFRINHLSDLGAFWNKILSLSGGETVNVQSFLKLTVLFYILHAIEYNPEFLKKYIGRPIPWIIAASIILLFMITALSNRQVQFYYFQF